MTQKRLVDIYVDKQKVYHQANIWGNFDRYMEMDREQSWAKRLNWDLEIGAMPVLGWIHGPSCGALRYPKKRDDQNSKPPNLPEQYLVIPSGKHTKSY